jgi:GntR family transcriptional regulator/MocR family aminotransferase
MGVRVNGLAHYRFAPAGAEAEPRPHALGFGNLSELQIRRGIRTLAEAVRHQEVS